MLNRSLAFVFFVLSFNTWLSAQTFRPIESLEQQLKATALDKLLLEVQRRGDATRGAIFFHKSAAACVQCHTTEPDQRSLGPNLAKLKSFERTAPLTGEYLLRSLLFPSESLLKGFETTAVLTDDGTVFTGIVESEDAAALFLRSPTDISKLVTIAKEAVEQRSISKQSLMPDAWMSSMRELADFLDLAAYVLAVADGGLEKAQQLKPTAEQLAIREDWLNLDHAGIIKKLKSKDFESGREIYQGYCVDCHGADGNRPNLPTARAFGTQPMKFGADAFQMFMTLTRGNGLMGPMSHLTPHQRYEVVHYIREAFIKPSNPAYQPTDAKYLASLPKGTEDGTAVEIIDRDFGPAVASQLDWDFPSVLTTQVGTFSVSHDLHTLNTAGVWQGGFLDFSQTQHSLPRGEGVVKMDGRLIDGFQGWRWGHAGDVDYPRSAWQPRGPMPENWMSYKGHYLHGTQTVLSYSIDERPILETVVSKHDQSIRRRLEIDPGKALVLVVSHGFTESDADWNWQSIELPSASLRMASLPQHAVMAKLEGDSEGCTWRVDTQKRLILDIPSSAAKQVFDVVLAKGTSQDQLIEEFATASSSYEVATAKPSSFTSGGPARWPEILTSRGYLGLQSSAYAVDTISVPTSTPWNTWFRTAALDFLSDGRMVVATYGGDLWLVSGIDDQLLALKWKRYAAGLYEPLGVRVVQDKVFVTCKDRIVCLHDIDGNDEADFYQNFSADTDVSNHFHAFNFDLQTDDQGNFYYAKGGHGSNNTLPGSVVRVSPDGRNREVVSTGFRIPNGMGSLPGNRLTCSDNQGQWMPASKINLLKPGAFYGWVPTYNSPGKWSADGGKIDIRKVEAPKEFEEPLVWLPHELDNSSGGQLWVDDPRWGPLSGRLLHTSFGKGWLYSVLIQEVGGVSQGAVIKFPHDFRTGIMRGRVNPKDGQVYVTGLQGWNGGGRAGLLDHGIQRVRYTGQAYPTITDAKVTTEGLDLEFNFPIDAVSIHEVAAIEATHWNYRWQASYGSEKYSPSTGKVGAETMTIKDIQLSDDATSLSIKLKELCPVDQLHLRLNLRRASGERFIEEVFWTIHRLPSKKGE
jgi:putative heme-binding domain-containing protein